MKTISFIGPRLESGGIIGGYNEETKSPQKDIIRIIDEIIKKHKTTHILLTSLQGGIERWAAQSAINNGMMFEYIIPFSDYETDMKPFIKSKINAISNKAHSKRILPHSGFSIDAMRNKDNELLKSDVVVSFYPPEIISKYRLNIPKNCIDKWPEIYKSKSSSETDSFYITL